MKHKVSLRNRGNITLEVDEKKSIIDVFEENGVILPVACR